MKHALAPIIDAESHILILGTMPGERSIALQQYYGNRGNHFWKILFAVFDEDFSFNYDTRKDLLYRHHIALWNVLASCEREGSEDKKIKNESANDFESLFHQYPKVSHIFFESKSAAAFFNKHVSPQPHISYGILPSTSGLNAGKTFQQKLDEWSCLKNISSLKGD